MTTDTRRPGTGDERGPIYVEIEPRARRRWRLLWGPLLALYATFPFMLADGTLKLSALETVFFICVIALAVVYSMPVWIGRWPAWVVWVFGRRHLLRMLSDARAILSNEQPMQARLRDPRSWLYDNRPAAVVIVVGMFAVGLWSALNG